MNIIKDYFSDKSIAHSFPQCDLNEQHIQEEPVVQVVEEDKLFDSDLDNMAYEAGWLVLCPEEAYEKCLSHGSSVYILKEDDVWVVWRGSWIDGSSTPTGQKTLAKTPSFGHALHRAERYVHWRMRDKGAKNSEESDLNREITAG